MSGAAPMWPMYRCSKDTVTQNVMLSVAGGGGPIKTDHDITHNDEWATTGET